MGLDMFVRRTRKSILATFNAKDAPIDEEEIMYWRKHSNLHGWMEQLYEKKGGHELFNCVCVELTAADIDSLERDVIMHKLPETAGFFFGKSSPNIQPDLEFIQKARGEISKGYNLFYDSWW